MSQGEGKVCLIGAGPGDPGLFTLKGKACLEKADVVVYDHLANPALLDFARPEAERLYVGKQGNRHAMEQVDIDHLLIQRAQAGQVVARLKGGDPFVFGRGGEEAEALAKAGVAIEVVPGVTAAVAVPAYAGIPLTHRDWTSTVAFVTGHEDPTKETSAIAWDHLATAAGTLVFFMGVGNLPAICRKLAAHGRSPDTPVAVIRWGTTPQQRTVTGTLGDIAQRVTQAGLTPPALVVVGEVVRLREALNWFESRPLFGKRILVTRARAQTSAFAQRLEALGAEVLQFPTIEIVPPESWEPLDQAISRIQTYHWVLFTSVNGVDFFHQRLKAQGKDLRALHGIKLCAIGPQTAQALRDLGLEPDFVPEEYRAEAIVTGLSAAADRPVKGLRFLLPRAAQAREVLPEELTRLGGAVDVVPAYRTVRPTGKGVGAQSVAPLLEQGRVDVVTFTSSSTVTYFVEMFAPGEYKRLLKDVTVACIGPITAKTASDLGIATHIQPEEYTIPALVAAIVHHMKEVPVP